MINRLLDIENDEVINRECEFHEMNGVEGVWELGGKDTRLFITARYMREKLAEIESAGDGIDG